MFIPNHRLLLPGDIDIFAKFLKKYYLNILVVTGAGTSTESGIPDYRSEGVGLYARTNHKPMQYQEFIKSAAARKRYWARNFLAWPRMASLKPNATHLTLAQMGSQVVTQNVDGLHSLAGSRNVIELHGSSHRVVCMKCRNIVPRRDVQTRLLEVNPSMEVKMGAVRPDGDVEVNEEEIESFRVVDCIKCGGILKPDIVFFGDNVPGAIVQKVQNLVVKSEALLVIGSSVTVFSAFRIVSQAKELNKFIFIVNIGATRADHLADCKLDVNCCDLFKNTKMFG